MQRTYPSYLEAGCLQSFSSRNWMKKELKGSKLTTARVRECMRLLITGLTVREIVQALGLSSRTVESYFENIKNKLNSWSKKDIYMFSIRLNEFLL